MRGRLPGVAAAGALLLLGACASAPDADRDPVDPWEPLNRTIYEFNDVVDGATLGPVARGYRAVTPRPVRKGVANFFANLATPRSIVNNLLQGKPGRSASETIRFLFNSTIGVGGLIDVAGAAGMESYTEDFGQTAAVWGVPDGPFVTVPFLGPRTLRDAVLIPLDLEAHPLAHYDNSSVRDKVNVLRIVDMRYRLLSAEQLLEDSRDPYVTLRESYLQNREFEVYDGNPPEDDDYFDEFFDEDE